MKLSDKEKEKIVSLSSEGYNLTQISKLLNRNISTIGRHAQCLGIKFKIGAPKKPENQNEYAMCANRQNY